MGNQVEEQMGAGAGPGSSFEYVAFVGPVGPGCPRVRAGVDTSSCVQALPQVSTATGGLSATASPYFPIQHGPPDIITCWLKLVL